jgi:hypothetical protein
VTVVDAEVEFAIPAGLPDQLVNVYPAVAVAEMGTTVVAA